ncbi:TetR/AcrR family transcriptional regulator [Gorillibacterium massiliense]|uniref:TetR/AcrR family transcriptional regulator n=1 Tax=Gorillibacterium massiliense TaxID=1280390 RepID=UPI0004ACDBC5|nr:TetR/AcrR family transcriptional regulator [Gorillibacterium massiliense]
MEPKEDRRMVKTKQAIRVALAQLMEEKGIDSLTVRDLTERANINRGTFYLHYRDKYDLLEKCEDEVLAILNDLGMRSRSIPLSELQSELSTKKMLPFVLKLLENFRDNAAFMKVLLGPKGDPSFQEKIKEVIKENFMLKFLGNRKKEDLPVPSDILIAYIASANLGVIQHWLNSDMKISPTEMAQIMQMINLNGPGTIVGLRP